MIDPSEPYLTYLDTYTLADTDNIPIHLGVSILFGMEAGDVRLLLVLALAEGFQIEEEEVEVVTAQEVEVRGVVLLMEVEVFL